MSERMKFASAMGKAFRKTGQALSEFASELKALSPEDKKWYHKELNAAGYECEEPASA